jgi:hypothetical protein
VRGIGDHTTRAGGGAAAFQSAVSRESEEADDGCWLPEQQMNEWGLVGKKEFLVMWTNERHENSQRIFCGELLYRSYRFSNGRIILQND